MKLGHANPEISALQALGGGEILKGVSRKVGPGLGGHSTGRLS